MSTDTATEEKPRTENIPCAATAKYIRKALKVAFPKTKFSVKSDTYAGGASIYIAWTDGPCRDGVESIAGDYQGGDFDGMADYKYAIYHWFKEGEEPVMALHPAAYGIERFEMDAPSDEYKRVHFGADFIFYNRHDTTEE